MIPFGPMAQESTNTYCMHKIGIMIQVFKYLSWVDSFKNLNTKTTMKFEFFTHDYATCDGLVNGVGGIFQG
jgi:hypothetical protein